MAPIISYRRFATFFLGAHFGKGTSFAVWPFGPRNHQNKVWNWLFWPFSGRSQTVAPTVIRLKINKVLDFFSKFFFRFLRRFFKNSKTHFFLCEALLDVSDFFLFWPQKGKSKLEILLAFSPSSESHFVNFSSKFRLWEKISFRRRSV